MADYFVWNEETLGLKIHQIDKDHQVLIDKMNIIYKAVQSKAGSVDIERFLNDLMRVTQKHFADEEIFMEKFKFQGIETHKIIHQQLLSRLAEHIAEFKNRRVMTESFFDFLKSWLTGHIRGIDTKYARAYLESTNGGAKKTA